MEEPRKVPLSQVEVIGADGSVVKEASESASPHQANSPFGNIKVIKAGPWMLFLLPLLIPVAIIGVILMMVLALLFGRGMFKLVGRTLRTR